MKRYFLAALAALVSVSADAAVLTWTNPTTFADGSPLAPADIQRTNIEWSNASPFGAVAGSSTVNGALTTAIAPDPAAGAVRCYRVSTTAIGAKGGATSVPSNVDCKAMPWPAPNPPTLLDVIFAFIKRLFAHFA